MSRMRIQFPKIKWIPEIQKKVTVSRAIGAIGSYHNTSYIWQMQLNQPFATFTKTKTKAYLIHDKDGIERFVTLAEMKVGGSFPVYFRFIDYKSALALIGNSVPPIFMYAIAKRIRKLFFNGTGLEMQKITDYPAYLDQCWQEHLQPKSDDAPTVISTFAGCGGSSLGYSMAGFRELLAVEWNDNAVATFKLNFPDVPVYHGNICKLPVPKCLELAGIDPGQLDILDGSPPCQGFSTAGKRKFGDDRNQLFREFVRLLRGLKPKVFVMENVSGLVKGKMKLIFAEIMRELKASGYKVKCRLLNAKYFGVPQSRQRLIFIGVREDFGIEPGHPEAETKTVPISRVLDISHLDYDTKGLFSEFNVNIYKKPFPTITKGNRHHFFAMFIEGIRKLTIKECQRIQSFPARCGFIGNESEVWKCIGNSVPPLMMRSIAKHIRREILSKMTGQEPVLLG